MEEAVKSDREQLEEFTSELEALEEKNRELTEKMSTIRNRIRLNAGIQLEKLGVILDSEDDVNRLKSVLNAAKLLEGLGVNPDSLEPAEYIIKSIMGSPDAEQYLASLRSYFGVENDPKPSFARYVRYEHSRRNIERKERVADILEGVLLCNDGVDRSIRTEEDFTALKNFLEEHAAEIAEYLGKPFLDADTDCVLDNTEC